MDDSAQRLLLLLQTNAELRAALEASTRNNQALFAELEACRAQYAKLKRLYEDLVRARQDGGEGGDDGLDGWTVVTHA